MSDQIKTIRSSGWQTDFIIGFPEGLLLLFFTTFLLHGMNITVQRFYTINTCIWLIGSLLVMITAFQANKGDTQHDVGTLSPAERQKLEDLEIGHHIIADIASEMEKDATDWENTLQEEQVQVTHFHLGRALLNAVLTGVFFLIGGILSMLPYLRSENFYEAAQNSVVFCFVLMVVFSFIKSRMTSQPAMPVILRNIGYTGAVYFGAWIMQLIFL
jgi:VIT1/CCC1 family predicted Fe2+/Mn2+ transporter